MMKNIVTICDSFIDIIIIILFNIFDAFFDKFRYNYNNHLQINLSILSGKGAITPTTSISHSIGIFS